MQHFCAVLEPFTLFNQSLYANNELQTCYYEIIFLEYYVKYYYLPIPPHHRIVP